MSRSNQNDVTVNPSKRFFEWSGKTGKLVYYDKEKKEEIEVPLPFTFLYLDQLNTVKGYNKRDKHGIWSNEVRDITKDKLSVTVSGNEKIEGLWKENKDKITNRGGKYTKSVYIAYFDGGELVIGNIAMNGSSFGGGDYFNTPINERSKGEKPIKVDAWLTFSKDNFKAIESKAIIMSKDGRLCENGDNNFYCPSFSLRETSPETDEKAKALDIKLQEYFKEYFKNVEVTEPSKPMSEEDKAAASFDQSPKKESFNQDWNNPFAPVPPTNAYATSAPIPTPQGNYSNNGAVGSLPSIVPTNDMPF